MASIDYTWEYLPEPAQARDYHHEWPWGKTQPPSPAAFLLSDGRVMVLGDWSSFSSDEGCGCCSSGRDDLVVAWAPLNIPPP